MFLRNCWYIAAEAGEVGRQPLGRIILNEPVVLYRKEDGTAVALEDRCCHRRAPLHKGEIVGDALQCGYHGFTFDAEGACIKVPGCDYPPKHARVRSYPICEKYRWLWIWMGEPARADQSLVPDLHHNDDCAWASTGSYIPVKANYLLLVENLIDLSHVAFIHKGTIGSTEDTNPQLKVERDDNFVRVIREALGIATPPTLRKLGFGPAIDQTKIITFMPPANITIDIPTKEAPQGRARQESPQCIRIMVLNSITPETERTCHYFWAVARDFDLDSAERSEFYLREVTKAFNEDKDILEAQQSCIDLDPDAPTINVQGDAGGVYARRIISRLFADETAAHGIAAQ